MAILVNQNNNLSGENLLASSSLENSINEARNVSIEFDQKLVDLKSKTDEFKQESDVTLTAVFAKLDKKEKSFNTNVNKSADDAANKIDKAVNELREGSEIIKNVSKTTSTIITHIVFFVIGLALILYLALPTIKQAKDVLADNKNVLQTAYNLKKENEKLRKENEQLTVDNKDMDDFILFLHGGDISKAQKGFRLWLKSKK